MPAPKTYNDIIKEEKLPAVAIDHRSVFTMINRAFTETYGWEESELLGQSVTMIMPEHMRDAHTVGFSRFLSTEQPSLLGKPLPLEVYCRDKRTVSAEHYIVGEKHQGTWRFAATITPEERNG